MALTDYVIMPGADYQAACDTIRAKTGKTAKITSGEMAAEIEGLKKPVIEPLEITENGTYTAPDGVDGYSPVAVNVAGGGADNSEFLTGTFTPAENQNYFHFSDVGMTLEKEPRLFIVGELNRNEISKDSDSINALMLVNFGRDSLTTYKYSRYMYDASTTTVSVGKNGPDFTKAYFQSGITYQWVVLI